MKKRWLIRGLALALLTLCVVVWVRSYFAFGVIERIQTERNSYLEIEWGYLNIFTTEVYFEPFEPYMTGWFFHTAATTRQEFEDDQRRYRFPYSPGTVHDLAGFSWRRGGEMGGGTSYHVWIPLWFPTLVSSLLLSFVWRKTRENTVGKAFPVEAGAKAGEK